MNSPPKKLFAPKLIGRNFGYLQIIKNNALAPEFAMTTQGPPFGFWEPKLWSGLVWLHPAPYGQWPTPVRPLQRASAC